MKRVAVTGMGVVSPIGNTLDEFWKALLEGKSGITGITRFDVSGYSSQIAGEIKNFDPLSCVDKKELRRMDLTQQYAVVAAEQAYQMAGLKEDQLDLDRCGVIIGSGIGGIITFEQQHETLVKSGHNRVSPFFIPMMIIDMCAGLVSIRYNFRGPNYATVSACSSSAHAIIDASRSIERGESDVMITGGAEAAITPTAIAGFCKARALSTRNDDPEHASRPFDVDRDGFVISEGAAILVLESFEHAQKRGARIYAEIIGGGMSADAHHITAPHPEGLGACNAMKSAFRDAGIKAEQVDYINTHGTSTGLGDIAESKAIKEVFGEYARKVPCNSTKSMTGHLLGAGGAVEAIACVKSIEEGIIHQTMNLENPDPECDLDYVSEGNREIEVNYAISNSFGFGGHNVTLVLKKPE